jgi:hypothetical protein
MISGRFRQAILSLAVVSLIGCGGGGGSEKQAPAGPVQEKLVLEAESLEYGIELAWNQERFPNAVFNLCMAEEPIGNRFAKCSALAGGSVTRPSANPVTLTGLTGGKRYWFQLEATLPTGKKVYSDPVFMAASISDDSLLGVDAYDWRNDPELEMIKSAISQQQTQFQTVMRSKNISSALGYVAVEQRDVYEALFSGNPDAMPAFAEILEYAEIDFLSPPRNENDTFRRMAEYKIEFDGFIFYLRWMETDNTWILFDF